MKKEFTTGEMEYLRALSAVANVTPTRIVYSEGFKRNFVHEYMNGKKPTAIFRDAGLPVVIIGRKRIERCTYRWIREVRYEDDMSMNDETCGPRNAANTEYALLTEAEGLVKSLSLILSRAERIVDKLRDELAEGDARATHDETRGHQNRNTGQPR